MTLPSLPQLPPIPENPVPPESAALDAPSEKVINAIYGTSGLSQALQLNGFTQLELVTRLIAQVRDANPKVSATAMKTLLAYSKDVLRLNGQALQITQKEQTDAKGRTRTTRTLTGSALRPAYPTATSLPPEGVRRTHAQDPLETSNLEDAPSPPAGSPGPNPPGNPPLL
jgi:hypothetical protein